jgi:hypothetical protein
MTQLAILNNQPRNCLGSATRSSNAEAATVAGEA